MKQKGRYNIKVAEKNNVIIRKTDSIDNFYSLYATMAGRQKITFRSKQYFQTLIDIMREKGYCEVSEAVVNTEGKDVVLAAGIFSYYQNQAIYLFGGSSDEMRNVMAPYKLQWEAILEAKKCGCKTYDFFGIAPNDNPRHAWAGVTRFKKQFGGEEVSILGSYDKIYKPFEYSLFKFAEKIRRH
jgi:lipid II:glycine glycyltransferase (peptidoglycan interpeptide bridge formation enzyme)